MKGWLGTFLPFDLLVFPLWSTKWALQVGVNNYPNEINRLEYCVAAMWKPSVRL